MHLEVVVVLHEDSAKRYGPAHDLRGHRLADEPADQVRAAQCQAAAPDLIVEIIDGQDRAFQQESEGQQDWVDDSGPLERLFE